MRSAFTEIRDSRNMPPGSMKSWNFTEHGSSSSKRMRRADLPAGGCAKDRRNLLPESRLRREPPLLSLYENERIPVEIPQTAYRIEVDRALENRYRHDVSYRTVYVDLDDTLVVKAQVNPDLVRLLYQELNRGKRLFF